MTVNLSPARSFALAVITTTLGFAQPVAAQDTIAPPIGADSATVASGRVLYEGRGACVPCHGERGEGTPEGPSLVTGRWKLGDGSFEWLLHITRHAGWGVSGRDGEPQRMRGPTVLDTAEVRRVATYVYSISRAKQGAKPAP
jgi:mono/diheme cytochrome c family protein